jgi:hypothetical protein
VYEIPNSLLSIKFRFETNTVTLGWQFQKIFVVSLPARTDRRDALTLAASVTNLEFEWIDGVDNVIDKALPPGGRTAYINSGTKGCWRSHMNALQR